MPLTEDDWNEIADAFAGNDDPRYGEMPAEEFRRLFARIANGIVQGRPAAPG